MRSFWLIGVILTLVSLPVWAQHSTCQHVGGVLMTNIGTVPYGQNGTNLGPVFGDLAGSVAATQQGDSLVFQHYWVTTAGDTINFKPATLTPVSTGDPNVVAVFWNNYRSVIAGGTGKFEGATGYLDYFGIADFKNLTLVLRYSGQVCLTSPTAR